MKKLIYLLMLCITISLSSLCFVGCGSGRIPIEEIVFAYDSIELWIGQSKQLDYEILPKNAKGYNLVWEIEHRELLSSISSSGYVRVGENYGETVVKVTDTVSGVSASCNIKITDGEVFAISLDYTGVKTYYYVGEEFDPTGLVVNANYQSGVEKPLSSEQYTLNYPDILTENCEVVVNYNNMTASFNLYVEEDYVTELSVTSPPLKTNYKIGEIFDPTGIKVELIYASEKTEDVTALIDFDNNPISFNSKGINITYGDYSTTYEINITPDYIINDIMTLQSIINTATNNSSIMISKGEFNISTTILIPKSKNITIFGQSEDLNDGVTITNNYGSIFQIVNDSDGESTVTIANLNLRSTYEQSSIISLENNQNYSRLSLELINNKFSTTINGNVINFANGDDVSHQNINLLVENCTNTMLGTSQEEENYLFNISQINNGELKFSGNNFTFENNILSINNSQNLSILLENSIITSDKTAILLQNVNESELLINSSSYIKGLPSINIVSCESLDTTIENSYLTAYQSLEDVENNETGCIVLEGNSLVNIQIKESEIRNQYISNDYQNAICHLILIKDGTEPSSNNQITLTDCNIIFVGNGEKFVIYEQTPTSIINEIESN